MPKLPHSRASKTTSIPIELIAVDQNHVIDPELLRLIIKQETGLIDIGLTRIREKNIVSGSYIRQDDKVNHISYIDTDSISSLMLRIRNGHRPALNVYWNQHNPNDEKWVCPDEENILAAYRALGIELVPCHILKPSKIPMENAVIWGRLENVPTYRRAIVSAIFHAR